MARKKTTPSTTLDFEQSLEQLTRLIERMEQGNLSLEESLKDFESGIALIRQCQKTLTEAQQKVQILIKAPDGNSLAPYTPDDN